jgi:glycosyltransferase involved in cell wall biosynthesis
MKVQSATVTLPLLDWRVLAGNSKQRIRKIDPEMLDKRPFLKGFGGFGYRSFVRIPWRESDTCFFEARRAIQLPAQLPGPNRVQRVLRRVYIDGPRVHFDLASFATFRPSRLRTTRYRGAAKKWWSAKVKIRERQAWNELTLDLALDILAARFEDQTIPKSDAAIESHIETLDETKPRSSTKPRTSNVSILQPQILLVCFVQRSNLPPSSVEVLKDRIWYLYDARRIDGDWQPDVNFVFVAEDAVSETGLEEFKELRRIRRELAWLHADLQFLLEVGDAVGRSDDRVNEKTTEAARKVADGLLRLDQDEAHGFSPLLFAAWKKARANLLALLRMRVASWIGRVPLPEWLTVEVNHGTDERQRSYWLTLEDSLRFLRNDYPGSEALQLGELDLVDHRLLDGKTSAEYSKERSSAFRTYFRKAQGERLKLSIVVPVHGHVFPLLACLESMARQTLVQECHQDIEILLIEDGPLDPDNPVLQAQEIEDVLRRMPLNKSQIRRFILRENAGRTTARNVGIFSASGEIIMFVDASMVLDQDHLAEHMIRHDRVSNIALLGFKENLKLASYTIECCNSTLSQLARCPDARGDWKWHHRIVDDDLDSTGVFRFRSRVLQKGESINYMQLTNWLRDFPGLERIGPRTLATFFQTNIVSVPANRVCEVGGFHSVFDDKLWGLEDSHLGALLLEKRIHFVPCPSATAFKIEHEESAAQRRFDLKRHRQLFEELLKKPIRHHAHEAQDQILLLTNKSRLTELSPLSEGGKLAA